MASKWQSELGEVHSLLPCESRGSNSGCQTWWQALLPTAPSCLLWGRRFPILFQMKSVRPRALQMSMGLTSCFLSLNIHPFPESCATQQVKSPSGKLLGGRSGSGLLVVWLEIEREIQEENGLESIAHEWVPGSGRDPAPDVGQW